MGGQERILITVKSANDNLASDKSGIEIFLSTWRGGGRAAVFDDLLIYLVVRHGQRLKKKNLMESYRHIINKQVQLGALLSYKKSG